jgi:hypothetical protein
MGLHNSTASGLSSKSSSPGTQTADNAADGSKHGPRYTGSKRREQQRRMSRACDGHTSLSAPCSCRRVYQCCQQHLASGEESQRACVRKQQQPEKGFTAMVLRERPARCTCTATLLTSAVNHGCRYHDHLRWSHGLPISWACNRSHIPGGKLLRPPCEPATTRPSGTFTRGEGPTMLAGYGQQSRPASIPCPCSTACTCNHAWGAPAAAVHSSAVFSAAQAPHTVTLLRPLGPGSGLAAAGGQHTLGATLSCCSGYWAAKQCAPVVHAAQPAALGPCLLALCVVSLPRSCPSHQQHLVGCHCGALLTPYASCTFTGPPPPPPPPHRTAIPSFICQGILMAAGGILGGYCSHGCCCLRASSTRRHQRLGVPTLATPDDSLATVQVRGGRRCWGRWLGVASN